MDLGHLQVYCLDKDCISSIVDMQVKQTYLKYAVIYHMRQKTVLTPSFVEHNTHMLCQTGFNILLQSVHVIFFVVTTRHS